MPRCVNIRGTGPRSCTPDMSLTDKGSPQLTASGLHVPRKQKKRPVPPQDPAKALYTPTQVAMGSRGPSGRQLNPAAGPRGISTPEPPSALESDPTLHPACACSQIEKWTNGNALVSVPAGNTLLTTLLSRRHSAAPRVLQGRALGSPPPTARPPGPVPSHCPTGSRSTDVLLKAAQREGPSPRFNSGNSSANVWEDFPPSCPPPRGTCCFCLQRAPGGFMAVHGMGPRALLNRTTNRGRRSLGTDPFQPLEKPCRPCPGASLPTPIRLNPCAPSSAAAPGPALLQRSQLSWVGNLFLQLTPLPRLWGDAKHSSSSGAKGRVTLRWHLHPTPRHPAQADALT